MMQSQSLRLAFASSALGQQLTEYVAQRLARQGFDSVTASMLNFLGSLDCDEVNYGAEIARRLNVSRQMVAKTIRELSDAGYLEQVEGEGRKKQILFTRKGEKLMSAARATLARLDGIFEKRVGTAHIRRLATQLENLGMFLSEQEMPETLERWERVREAAAS